MSYQGKPLYGSDERKQARELSKRGVVQLIRVSQDNAIGNQGSRRTQDNQTRHLARHERWLKTYGIDPQTVTKIDVCESAKGIEDRASGSLRAGLAELLRLIREGKVGLIVVSWASRLARDIVDGGMLLDEARKAGVQFLVGGRFYNPKNHHEYNDLIGMIAAARLENMERALIVTQTRDDLARDNEFVIHLPTGLLWADPNDEAYREMMKRENLEHHLTEDMLGRHVAKVKRNRRTLHVLPDPYPGVFRACQMICGWMLAHRDPAQVILGIRTDPAYPEPGCIPITRGYRFPHRQEVQWIPATVARLYKWFQSPALYGTYQHTSRALAKYVDVDDPEHSVPDAFPSFMKASDQKIIRAIFADPSRKWPQGAYAGPKNHAIADLVCGHPMEDGTVCGCRIRAQYYPSGTYRYQSMRCRPKGHPTSHHGSIEAAVLEILEDAFQSEAVVRAVERLRLGADTTRTRRAHLRAEIEELETEMQAANEKEVKASLAEDPGQESRWQRHWTELNRRRIARQREFDQLEEAARGSRRMTEAEFRRIQALASNVRTLLQEARAAEASAAERAGAKTPFSATGLLRRIVSGLTEFISVRQLWRGVVEITVHFTNGARVQRMHVTERPLCSQPERVWIYHALRQGTHPEELAENLNAIRGRVTSGRLKDVWPWTADRVRTAAVLHEHWEETTPRDGRHTGLAKLAERVGAPLEEVSRATLLGSFGPARYRQGSIAVRPTPEELHAAFPEFARRGIARRQKWDADDTVPLHECAREFGRSAPWVITRAERGSGLVRDFAGRAYVRRSDIAGARPPLEMALAEASDAVRALDRKWWMSKEELRQKYPDLAFRTVAKRVPTVRLNQCYVFYHVPPRIAERHLLPDLSSAIAKLGMDGVEESAFWRRDQVVAFLRERFGFGSKTPLENAGNAGHITQVRARGGPKGKHSCWYIFVPSEVQNTTDEAVARRWLRGEL